MDLFSDHRLGGTFKQVPDVEVGGSVQHAEDCRSGLRPLNGHHRASTVPPLCQGLLVLDLVQPDAAVPTSHLENTRGGTTHGRSGSACVSGESGDTALNCS